MTLFATTLSFKMEKLVCVWKVIQTMKHI